MARFARPRDPSELAGTLLELGLSDLDLSGVTGPTRALTQVIARWAYEQGHTGLAYPSRFDEALTLWAIFEGAAFVTVGVPEPIEPDDADLAATAQLFGLTRECVFPTPANANANEATTTGRQAWMENEPAGWAAHTALSTLTIRGASLMEQNRIPTSATTADALLSAVGQEAERKAPPTLPVLHAGGFSASVDAFAWEPDPAARRMQLWFLSLLGPKEAVKALWARLIKGEVATISFEAFGKACFCVLAPEGPRGWRFFTATLRAAAGYHGLLVPEAAPYPTQRADFLLLPRRLDEAARLHYQFLNRRLDLPLHPNWADWLWERALETGEAAALESHGLHAYRCSPNPTALADDLRARGASGYAPRERCGCSTPAVPVTGYPFPVRLCPCPRDGRRSGEDAADLRHLHHS